jgi:hypothetical protein
MFFAFDSKTMWPIWHILFLLSFPSSSSSTTTTTCFFIAFVLVRPSHQLSDSTRMASSSRARSSSPFSYRKPSTPYSSTSSSSSFVNSRIVPRSCSSSASSFFNSGGGLGVGGSRSMTPSRSRSDSMYNGPRGYNGRSPVGFPPEDLLAEPLEAVRSGSGDSISVTIRFRPLRY